MTHFIVQCDECLDEFLEYHEKDIRRHIKKNKVNKYRSTGQKHTIVVLQCDISTEIMPHTTVLTKCRFTEAGRTHQDYTSECSNIKLCN